MKPKSQTEQKRPRFARPGKRAKGMCREGTRYTTARVTLVWKLKDAVSATQLCEL